MERALSKHGARGQRLLQKRLQVEQIGEQERQKSISREKLAKEQDVLGRILSGEKVSPEDLSSLSPDTQIKVLKEQSRAPAGGITGQPVPGGVQEKIVAVMNDNPNASAEELNIEMVKAGVPPAFSNSFVESRRRVDEADLKTFDKGANFEKEILDGFKGYQRDKNVLGQMENLLNAGNLSTPLLIAAFDKIGLPLGVLGNADSEQFQKLSQELVKNIQATYGSRILKIEVDNFMKSIPTLLNSPEGQKKLINQWQIINEGKRAHYDAFREVRAENTKRLPKDFNLQVVDRAEDRVDELSEEFLSLNTPSEGREQVQQGTQITEDVARRYLSIAGGDKNKAREIAREDGYEL